MGKNFLFYLVVKLFFSIHCFNKIQINGECIDLELSYYIKCYAKYERSRRSDLASPCFLNSQILLLSTVRVDNDPMVISSNGELFSILNMNLIHHLRSN